MYTPIVENLKGMAYVEDLDAFENFVMDFYIIDNAVFETIEDWYAFFCEGEDNFNFLSNDFDILQLIEDLNEDIVPKSFPAMIMFDFEEYSIIHTMRDEVLFKSVSMAELDIKKIEVRENSYSVAFV